MLMFEDEELLPVVRKVLAKVEPTLALDGGSVALLGVRAGVVYVQLRGACAGCSHSSHTLKNLIEKRLKDEIHQGISIINLSTQAEVESMGLL
jgi:Fe-S cluster biogenesis protein NfuA